MKQLVQSPKVLGQFLNRVRKKKGLTQREAGKPLRIDQTTVSNIERGADGTHVGTLFRLLSALDLEVIVREKNSSADKEVDW